MTSLKYIFFCFLTGWMVFAAESTQAGQTKSVIEDHARDTHIVAISRGRPITGKEDFIAPKWSPDGCFILLTKGKYSGLYILSLESRSVRMLMNSPGVGYAAEWRPDGRFIAFRENNRLKIVDMNGKLVTSEYAPSLEASSAVFVRDDMVFFRNNQTGREIRVSRGEDKFFLPQLSPDQKKVAYSGLTSGIHIRNLESDGTVSMGQGTDVVWTPDSKGIIYTYTRDDGHRIVASDLYYADAGSGKSINLTNSPGRQECHASISPTGKQLAYIVDGQVFLSDLRYGIP